MKYLKIQNDGELDIRLVALMGGTTKSTNEYKIGQFGTGLKYTLAYLFRNNLDFKIFVGTTEIKIHIEKELIADTLFEIICINGKRTSITTKMGEDWSAWMIIRELWCNALDEGGEFKDITDEVIGEEGKTTFYIQEDSNIKEVLKDWDKYFIHSNKPIFKSKTYTLYPAGNKLSFYKKGVLIFEHPDKKGLFSYDIGNADINELREFKGILQREICHALVDANENAIEYLLANITEEHFEGDMDWDWYVSFSDTWEKVIGSSKIIYPEVLKRIQERGNCPDLSTLIIVPKTLFSVLSKQFSNISAVSIAQKAGAFYEDFSENCENKIKQGLVILEACNYVIHPELEFVYGFFEDKRVLAEVNIKEKKVYISNTLLQKPLICIVSMLIEENEHFNTGMADHTREFQQHFIDLYARQLLATNKIEI